MYNKKLIAILIVLLVAVPVIYIILPENKEDSNIIPTVEIVFPYYGSTVSNIVTINGVATDPDGDDKQLEVEICILDEWFLAEGNQFWSYEWKTYDIEDGFYTIYVRSWDGKDYSKEEELLIKVENPKIVESDAHKWAVFIAASNFPANNESKLGNGALNLAEDMAAFFIEEMRYSTKSIFILFDDGWIRSDNGYGKPIETLQQRKHKYDITYGKATKDTVITTLKFVLENSNKFDDSEVFIWFSSHGCGDQSKKLFGGKILERSAIFLWDDLLTDKELGNTLSPLRSKKTCIIVDACFSGGFADKTILNIPELFLFNSNIPKTGRVVMTGASKFRVGYASTTTGPLFSQLWFYGLSTGVADGFRPFIFKIGRPTKLKIFKDGKVSVEEAFYFARYFLKTDKNFEDYDKMEPQINDQYPKKGLIRSYKGMILGE